MAGIYIHIPFCRQKCYYCDFYKTVNNSLTSQFINTLKKEILLRKDFTEGEKIETIYFGGGTPSVLKKEELEEILHFLKSEFSVLPDAEITFEANPDDLTPGYLNAIFEAGVNRLSIGIQSFQDKYLKKMNRRHSAKQAVYSVLNAEKTGFRNISADLIYGLPNLTIKEWRQSLNEVFQLPVNHLSAYHLTYHEGTPFYTWLKKGTLKELSEQQSVEQFNVLIDKCREAGFEQYEISNFARNQHYSKHNTAYWTGETYLGLGPSAHSFNGLVRTWNVAHVESYIKAIEKGSSFFQQEVLSETDRYNEYILTHIRTKWGVSAKYIRENFGEEKANLFSTGVEKYLQNDLLQKDNGNFVLKREGLFVSDDIMANLMII
ncbi:MAG: radical SAM family heme chaperone HemW [Tangfeifania sp.]